MTNKEDSIQVDCKPPCDPRLAKVLAIHLVGQVLDEAYVIANAAKDSGQSWRHMSMLKNFTTGRLSESDDADESLCVSKGDSGAVNENKMDVVANIVATSTPQKVTGEYKVPNTDTSFIGQGDEDSDIRQNELTKSTSMFLNHLFDMSEVEKVVICDDHIDNSPQPNDVITQAMTKIMESYINTALGVTYDTDNPTDTTSNENSEYSLMADACSSDVGNTISFYIQDDYKADGDKKLEGCSNMEIAEGEARVAEELVQNLDVAKYEHAFLTLNRDYDQYSEDDAGPILQDPKSMNLQEIELMTADTSEDNVSAPPDIEGHATSEKPNEFVATSAISAGASGSRKSSIAHRFRIRSSRILACIRSWWRRRTPGKNKVRRFPSSVLGMCPASPDSRRRTTSLLDQRLRRSPSPSTSVVWKFNTVNEALLNSSRWKECNFDQRPNEGIDTIFQ